MKSILIFTAGGAAISAINDAGHGDAWLAMLGLLLCGLNLWIASKQEKS
ncbi:MAG TPA: hypothetical protein VJ654_02915 [Noviherbaspirillum sp.]|nr:hypothetical protein [Noviherbaspirillum sp.]